MLDVFCKTAMDSELEVRGIGKAKNIGFRVFAQGMVTYDLNNLGLSAY